MRSIVVAILLALVACKPVDENLGTTSPDAAPPGVARTAVFGGTRWAIRLGSRGDDHPERLALDSQDNVIVAGSLAGPPDPAMQYDPMTGVLTKRARLDGHELWSVHFTDTNVPRGSSWIYQMAVDRDDSVVVVGEYGSGTVDLGGQTLSCTPVDDCIQTFVARYDHDGHLEWVHAFAPGLSGPAFTDLALGPDGSIFLTGTFTGSFDLGAGSFASASSAGVLLALDRNGVVQWQQIFEGGDFYGAGATAIATSSTGEIAVTGVFSGRLAIAGQIWSLDVSVPREFVARYAPDGRFEWARWLGPTTSGSEIFPRSVAFGPSDGILVYDSEHDGTGYDHLDRSTIHALAPGGNDVWTAQSMRTADAGALSVRGDGMIVTGGASESMQPDFGTGVLSAPPGMAIWDSMYLAAYDGAGQAQDVVLVPTSDPPISQDGVVGLAAMKDGGVAVTGYFDQTIDIGGTTLTSPGANDIAIFVIDPPPKM
jgi:hypothetical protein